MNKYNFAIGQKYKREQISQQAGGNGETSGNWATGYPSVEGVTFIFANVGSPGQTGHDYDNFFDGNDLIWRGRTGSARHQPSIVRITSPDSEVHVFWRSGGRDLFTYAGLGRAVEVSDEVPVRVRWQLYSSGKDVPTPPSPKRLPASELNKVRPDHIYNAVLLLLTGYSDHPFAPSTDYDVLTDDGHRLPPKAVFGIAAQSALGIKIGPYHFTAGLDSPCFRSIQNAGFRIVSKGDDQFPDFPSSDTQDQSWTEGNIRVVTHKRRERSTAAIKAKKSQFKAEHGKLFCEQCNLDPVAHYGTEQAESCIEVHHRDTQVQHMTAGHGTTLAALQCLCANCHRLEHKRIRDGEMEI